MSRRGWVVIGSSVLAVVLAAVLWADLVDGTAQLIVLFADCALVAVAVAYAPAAWRKRLAPLAGVFVAAAGVLPVFLLREDDGPKVDPVILADLVRRGPFTEQLPRPYVAGSMADVGVDSPGATRRVGAAQLKIRVDRNAVRDMRTFPEGLSESDKKESIQSTVDEISPFAHIEIYSSPEEAARRKASSRIELFKRDGGKYDSWSGDCMTGSAGGDFFVCVAARGHAYAEVTIPTSTNAWHGLAAGTVSALVRYTDRMSKLAS